MYMFCSPLASLQCTLNFETYADNEAEDLAYVVNSIFLWYEHENLSHISHTDKTQATTYS